MLLHENDMKYARLKMSLHSVAPASAAADEACTAVSVN